MKKQIVESARPATTVTHGSRKRPQKLQKLGEKKELKKIQLKVKGHKDLESAPDAKDSQRGRDDKTQVEPNQGFSIEKAFGTLAKNEVEKFHKNEVSMKAQQSRFKAELKKFHEEITTRRWRL